MTSSQIYIVRDEEDGVGLSLGGGQWAYTLGDNYFDGRIIWPGFAVNTSSPRGSFSYTFEGTSIAFRGVSAPVAATQVFQITIDQNAPYNTSTTDQFPQHYMQWYQSPQLSDGQHTIVVQGMDGQALDYMVVTPGQTTNLAGQTLMVDDTYGGIKYTGSGWQLNKNSTFPNGPTFIGGYNFQNTTHQTSTVGDGFEFRYTGTNLSVWGNFLYSQVGSMSLSYTIDGGTNFSKTFTSQGQGSNPAQQPNYLLLDTGPLADGNHTLSVTLSGCIGQSLLMDYILYAPSFLNLASMPNLTDVASASSSGTSTATATIGATSGAQTSDGGSDGGSGGSKSNAGAIAGGVVGGLAAIALIGAFLFWLLRKRSQRLAYQGYEEKPPSIHPAAASPYIVEPFVPASPGSLQPQRSQAKQPSTGLTSSFGNLNYGSSPDYDGSSVTTSPSLPNALVPNRRAETPSSGTGPSSSTQAVENVAAMRKRLEHLTEENRALSRTQPAPPAYG